MFRLQATKKIHRLKDEMDLPWCHLDDRSKCGHSLTGASAKAH
jgi:hypothetical protein